MENSQSLVGHPHLQRKGPHGRKGRALEHRFSADAMESIPAPMATAAPAEGDRREDAPLHRRGAEGPWRPLFCTSLGFFGLRQGLLRAGRPQQACYISFIRLHRELIANSNMQNLP